jgi:ribosome-binding factor A
MKESNRQKKFGKMIQKELSEVLAREFRMDGSPMLSVTVVRGTPDLKIARIYVSVFPDDKAQMALGELTTRNREVRQLLAVRMRHQLRYIPELQFYLDDTLNEVDQLEKLFQQIKPLKDEPEA